MSRLIRTSAALVLALAATTAIHADENFSGCTQFFANGKPSVFATRPGNRALCYDAFAILHSGESKTPVFVAGKLSSGALDDTHQKRSNKFFADARLPSAERATLEESWCTTRGRTRRGRTGRRTTTRRAARPRSATPS